MWLYTKPDANETLGLSHYDCTAPISLWVLRQHQVIDQPLLLLRRGGKTVALLSDDDTLPISPWKALVSTETEAEPILMVWTPPGHVRTSTRAVAEGGLARLEDLLEGLMLSGLYQEQSAMLQLIPWSEAPKRVYDMWGWVLLEDMDLSNGLAPFALPPGTPQVDSIQAWATNGSLDRALEMESFTPQHRGEFYTMYHREMLEKFGVRFGEEGGYSIHNVKEFPPLVLSPQLGLLRIDVDHIGGVDVGLLPYKGSYQDMRIGFIHLLRPKGNRAESTQEADFEQCRGRAMSALFCAQTQPFYLDVTDGKRHHILYRSHNTHVTVHTDCTPVEAYSLLSGLLKGELTYGGALPDPGHFRCPAYHKAPPPDSIEAPRNASSSVMPGKINADSPKPYVEDALIQRSTKAGRDTATSDASDSEDDESSTDEEESRAGWAQAEELEESLDLEATHEDRIDPLQSDGEESECGCSGAAVSDDGSDSCCSDAEWEII